MSKLAEKALGRPARANRSWLRSPMIYGILGAWILAAGIFLASGRAPNAPVPVTGSSAPRFAPPVQADSPDLAERPGDQERVPVYSPLTSTTVFSSSVYLPLASRYFQPGYVSPFGIAMYGNVDEASGLTAMQTAGARWVTTMLVWSVVEPNPPVEGVHTYNWTAFDAKASNARAAGLKVFVLVIGNPAWAAACPGGPLYEERVADMSAFVTALAERYDGDGMEDAPGSMVVNDWSFYSEPDNGEEWRCYEQGRGYWGYNGAGYAELLSTLSPAIHAANPNARVLIGGVAYDWFTDDTPTPGPFVRSFLGDTLQALNNTYGGARAHIDAVAFHFYPISTWRWPTIREKALEIQGILEQHGVGDLPLLVPEMGYWSAEEAGSSETRQAQYLAQTYARGLSAGIEQLSWLGVFDDGEGTEEHGLFWGQGLANPKMAYEAYATLANELAGASYAYPLVAPGAEGYLFVLPDGGEKTALWSVLNPSAWVAFAQSCLRQVGLTGLAQDVQDGSPLDGDGTVDGQIQLEVFFEQPVYVGTCD